LCKSTFSTFFIWYFNIIIFIKLFFKQFYHIIPQLFHLHQNLVKLTFE
jgi:hypothetical protein